MASSRSSSAANSAGVSGKAHVSSCLRTQSAAPTSTEHDCGSAASKTLPIAASRLSSAVASAAASAARPFDVTVQVGTATGPAFDETIRPGAGWRCALFVRRFSRGIAAFVSIAWRRRSRTIIFAHLFGNEGAALRLSPTRCFGGSPVPQNRSALCGYWLA
eukprot:758246-Pleurochrysis_carterae.AAC.2